MKGEFSYRMAAEIPATTLKACHIPQGLWSCP